MKRTTLVIAGLIITMLFFSTHSSVERPLSQQTQTSQAKVGVSPMSVIIDDPVVWEDQEVILSDTTEVLTGGNLTIIGSSIDCTFAADSDIDAFKIDDGGVIVIKDSVLFGGAKAIDGDSNGRLFLENVTFRDFVDDVIDLKGDYEVTANYLLMFDNGRNGIQIDQSTQQITITNSYFSNTGKDTINLFNVNALLRNVSSVGSRDDGFQIEGDGAIHIQESWVDSSAGDSIKFRDVRNGYVLIEDTKVTNGGEDGIQISNVANFTLQRSTLRGNTENGLQGIDLTHVTLLDNLMEENGVSGGQGNGVELDNCGVVYIRNISSQGNGNSGFRAIGLNQTTVEDSTFSGNKLTGSSVSYVSEATFTNNEFSFNTGASDGSNGFAGIHSQNLTHQGSMFLNNSGAGAFFENTSVSIRESSSWGNTLDGITVGNQTFFTIENSTVQQNSGNGIFVEFSSDGAINYNTIQENSLFGLAVSDNRTSPTPLDANYNYWGDDKGPLQKLNSEGIRDDYSGPANVTWVLSSGGEVRKYTPPIALEIDYQLLFGGLVVLLLAVAVVLGLTYLVVKQRWRKSTKPQLVLLMTTDGLPLAKFEYEEGVVDETMISGFITAVSSFSGTIIGEEGDEVHGSIEEIKHQQYILLMRNLGQYNVVLVTRSSNPVTRSRFAKMIQHFIKELEKVEQDDEDEPVDVEVFEELIPTIAKPFFDYYSN